MEERLRKFAYLVDTGSFTKAAAELHVSQPALSTSIAKLERELGTSLLVRGTRPLRPTPAGELAYRAAKDLAVQTDNLQLQLAELAKRPVRLRIGMIDSVADALFSHDSSLDLFENDSVSVVVNNSRYLSQAVERGELDVALIAAQHKRPAAAVETTPLAVEPLVVVARADRPVESNNSLPDFIGYDQPSNTFRLVQRALKNYGVSVHAQVHSTSPDVMLRLVQLGKGVAALPYLKVRTQLQSGELRRLGGEQPWLIPRPIVVLKRRNKQLPAALTALVGMATERIQALLQEAQTTSDYR